MSARDRLPGGEGPPQRIAVLGAGIAGLACAWLLARRHAVTLYEAEARLGGHTHTVDVSLEGITHPVDTGFLVFNRRTYPNLCALFAHLDIDIAASDMSFSVSLEEEGIEWAGSNLGTVFAQAANLARPAFWGMLQDIVRFNRAATAACESAAEDAATLGDWLERGRYGRAFRDWYLLPMAAAIWSCPTRTMLDYPFATFARFCANHGLLQVADRPPWLTVRGGGRTYLRRLAAGLDDVRSATPVLGLRRGEHAVWVRTAAGEQRYDQVVIATHSDQALRVLGDGARADERALLGAIRYQSNRVLLHTDTALLPRRPRVWSAWNYLAGRGAPDGRPVSVSYLINRLQPLPFARPVIVSLNPFHEPAPEHRLREFEYAHPVFDLDAIDAQRALPHLQGRDRTWYCGAWCGYGFHEDGLRAALAVANALGVRAPWQGDARHAGAAQAHEVAA